MREGLRKRKGNPFEVQKVKNHKTSQAVHLSLCNVGQFECDKSLLPWISETTAQLMLTPFPPPQGGKKTLK